MVMIPAMTKVTDWILAHKEALIRDLFDLVQVPSVSEPDSDVRPFGQPCQDALNVMYRLAEKHGFASKDFGSTVGRIDFTDNSGKPSIGIWCHLDVVPVPNPEDWVYPPFQGTAVEGRYLIGRGIQDNKMPAIAVFYVMMCLLDLGWQPKKQWSLCLGTSEENGMDDVRWFVERYPCPDLNLVPDTGFPVCTAQRGCQILRYAIPLELPDQETLSFRCGSNISVTPEHVTAVFSSGNVLRTDGHGYHIVKADDNNAVLHMLAKLEDYCPDSAASLHELSRLLSSTESMGIAYCDEESGAVMAKPTQMDWQDGQLTVDVYSVLPVTSDPDALLISAQNTAKKAGPECTRFSMRPPCHFRKDHPLVQVLTEVYRDVTGDASDPFIMTGGNYASLLPNALGFGPGMPGREFPEHIFPQGHGDYHQCDESEDWEHIVKFMQVYAMAILRLDNMDAWES